jgi:4,5-DOPA dioxygenase extradiol
MTIKLPSIFISHGSPMLALENEPTTIFLRGLAAEFKKPKAIIIASAHFETENPTITGGQNYETIHDFHGFPDELYQLRYNAKGDAELAARIKAKLDEKGFAVSIDNVRGLDHGAWNPLLLMYPQADIPVIEISIQPHMNAEWHYNIGAALREFRDDILIIGTGNLTHNLREAFRGQYNGNDTPSWVKEFADWVEEKLVKNDVASLLKWQELAPYAKENHPDPGHFLPFFVALGAGSESIKAEKLHDDVSMNVLAMDAYAFN